MNVRERIEVAHADLILSANRGTTHKNALRNKNA